MAKHLEIGKSGENAAVKHLKKNGYIIQELNFKCKLGEIDIVANHMDTIVFVEVKTRKNNLFGTPGQAVTKQKQRKIIKTALYYLKINRKYSKNVRFDIVEVWQDNNKVRDINIIPNAFLI